MNFKVKSSIQNKEGDYLKENIEVIVTTENGIIFTSIINVDSNINWLEKTPMEIVQEDLSKFTIEGLRLDNPINKWNKDFSNIGIRFMRDAMGRPGVTILCFKNKNETISILPS